VALSIEHVRFLLQIANVLATQPQLMQYNSDGFQESVAQAKRLRSESSAGEGGTSSPTPLRQSRATAKNAEISQKSTAVSTAASTTALQIGKLRQKAAEEEEQEEEEGEEEELTQVAPESQVKREIRAKVNLNHVSFSLIDPQQQKQKENTIASLMCASLGVNLKQSEEALELSYHLKDISLSDSIGSANGALRPLLAIQPIPSSNDSNKENPEEASYSIAGEYKQRDSSRQYRHPVGVPIEAKIKKPDATKEAEKSKEILSTSPRKEEKKGPTRQVDEKEVVASIGVRIARVTVIPRPKSMKYFMKVQADLLKELQTKEEPLKGDEAAKVSTVAKRKRHVPIAFNRSDMTVTVSLHSLGLDLTAPVPAEPTPTTPINNVSPTASTSGSENVKSSTSTRDAFVATSQSLIGQSVSQFRLSFSNLNLNLKMNSAKSTFSTGLLSFLPTPEQLQENIAAGDEERMTLGFTFSELLLEDLRDARYVSFLVSSFLVYVIFHSILFIYIFLHLFMHLLSI
jgi:hypothetical protein